MRKRILLFFSICATSLITNAQLNKEVFEAYIDDVKMYYQAITDIIREHKYEVGISALTTLIERCEKNADYPLDKLASYHTALGQGWIHMKQYQQAITEYEHAISLLQKSGDKGNADMSITLYQLSTAYYLGEKKSEALDAANNCIKAALDYYGPYHSETLDAYSLRSNIAGYYDKKDIALSDCQTVFDIIQKKIEQNFVYLTTQERSAYWKKYLPETSKMFAFAHKLKEWDGPFCDALFDQQLLAKGLLLTAESSLQRVIDANPSLNTTYQKIRQLRVKASDDKTMPKEAESATLEADRLERQLGATAGSLHQFLDFLKVHTNDVRTKLKSTDVAIEFVDYRVGKDSTMYAALVMSPRWNHVRLIPLLEEKEVVAHSDNLTPYLWQPILDALGYQPETIYFAPSGLLYQYPIESQAMENNRLISEICNLYRISSTRWLAFSGDNTQGHDAVVYGGLTYDTNVVEMQKDAARYASNRVIGTSLQRMRAAVINEYPYLPGTKTEAESITQTINYAAKKELHAETLLGNHGTEASFKNLDGQFKRIIHVATHGFYQEDKLADKQSLDNALDRSALLFAGAENKLYGRQLPQGVDDGLLTALEISQLDLRGLDLVVLSACETGQGHITSDGVFGLQRGFKKAGANSILMSLWKVDDNATCVLMTEFYKNWIDKEMTKHDALEEAKKLVRSHKEKGWDSPKYWAAFILLDAI